jgi:hypothetical protein
LMLRLPILPLLTSRIQISSLVKTHSSKKRLEVWQR